MSTSSSLLKLPLRGIIPPMATPLLAPDRLDHAGLERLIEHLVAGGVHGLFILGSCGEGPSLGYRVQRELVERTVEQVAGRVPVLVGITSASMDDAVELAEFSEDVGAAAAVCAPPFYFPNSQNELVDYFEQLSREVPLPLVLYNMPGLCKTAISLDTVRRLLDSPNIIGCKDSSGDLVYFNHLCGIARERRDWCVFIGPEELVPQAIFAGAHGGVSGGANLFPQWYVAMYAAAARGDYERAAELHQGVLVVSRELYTICGGGAGSVVKGLKMGLAALGICSNIVTRPFRQPTADEQALARERIEKLKIQMALPTDRVALEVTQA